jgi:hypothetical protein
MVFVERPITVDHIREVCGKHREDLRVAEKNALSSYMRVLRGRQCSS